MFLGTRKTSQTVPKVATTIYKWVKRQILLGTVGGSWKGFSLWDRVADCTLHPFVSSFILVW